MQIISAPLDRWVVHVFETEIPSCDTTRNVSVPYSDEMSERGVDKRDERYLKGVFKVQGKAYDVYLDRDEIVWTLQGELNTGIR